MCPIHDQNYIAVHKFDMALSVFGRVQFSLSLAMRVLVVNVFMFTLFSYPNRHLLQENVKKVLRFLTPTTWAKLGMSSAVGALYGGSRHSKVQKSSCLSHPYQRAFSSRHLSSFAGKGRS